jgi:hypothetical protein
LTMSVLLFLMLKLLTGVKTSPANGNCMCESAQVKGDRMAVLG